jgi:hypothetical protein
MPRDLSRLRWPAGSNRLNLHECANRARPELVVTGMELSLLKSKFARIGARMKVADRPARRNRMAGAGSLDVRADAKGEFFEIVRPSESEVEVTVLDVRPPDRHLVLMVREGKEKSKFLCGHDERHWFVAGIPEAAPVGTVRQAKEALKPAEVRVAEARLGLGANARDRRKNTAFIRQGEWFFLPILGFLIDDALILTNEPLRRSTGGKPHWTEFCYRTGGETVYVCNLYPNGVTPKQYKSILDYNARARGWDWLVMRRNAGVYVKGRIRHQDHATVILHGWHRVLMNTEGESRAMRDVAFLD